MNIETEVVNIAVKHFGKNVKCVLLFGSKARETSREGSDYDFLIILEEKTENPEFWRDIFLLETKTGIPMDVLVVSKSSLKPDNPLIWGVLTGYKVLYGEKEWKQLISKLRKGIKTEAKTF